MASVKNLALFKSAAYISGVFLAWAFPPSALGYNLLHQGGTSVPTDSNNKLCFKFAVRSVAKKGFLTLSSWRTVGQGHMDIMWSANSCDFSKIQQSSKKKSP